ncbi:MAG: HEAT repeat domain-containing protein [Planctomycetota bacterium]
MNNAVVRALVQLGDKRAFGPLIQALSHKNYRDRQGAAYQLGLLGDSKAIEPLRKALKDSVHSVRKAAKDALNKLNDITLTRVEEK